MPSSTKHHTHTRAYRRVHTRVAESTYKCYTMSADSTGLTTVVFHFSPSPPPHGTQFHRRAPVTRFGHFNGSFVCVARTAPAGSRVHSPYRFCSRLAPECLAVARNIVTCAVHHVTVISHAINRIDQTVRKNVTRDGLCSCVITHMVDPQRSFGVC